MIETFIALLFAHVLADFVFQSDWMAEGKQNRNPGALVAHFFFVLGLAWLAMGTLDPVGMWLMLVLAIAHILIDLVKGAFQPSLTSFLADQSAHAVTLLMVAQMAPDMWEGGYWSGADWLPGTMAVLAGFFLATRTGGFVMQLLMTRFAEAALPPGLTNGGALIGFLERSLIFVFVLAGQPEGIGFLIAAKSVLRLGTTREDQRASEYVIIGTLASFGWAMVVAWSTLALVSAVGPLGILPGTT